MSILTFRQAKRVSKLAAQNTEASKRTERKAEKAIRSIFWNSKGEFDNVTMDKMQLAISGTVRRFEEGGVVFLDVPKSYFGIVKGGKVAKREHIKQVERAVVQTIHKSIKEIDKQAFAQ